MAITYHMLQIPATLLFNLMVLTIGIAAGFGTYFFNKYIRIKLMRSHNEVTGFLFLAIASFQSLLLSFVVFLVWGEFIETQANMTKEGSSAMGLYRDIKNYPEIVDSKKLMVTYLHFIFLTIEDEIPAMKVLKPSPKTDEAFNKMFYEMERIQPKNNMEVQLVSGMFHHLNEVSNLRSMRISSVEKEIPAPLWLPMVLGAIITILCAMLLDIEHARMHVVLNTMLGMFIGLIFFMIILLDHPFTGSLSINPTSYKQIILLEKSTQDAIKPILKSTYQ